MRRRLCDERGLTVVELTVVTAVMGLVLAMLVGLLTSVQRNEETQQARIRNQEEVRLLMTSLSRDIRSANPPLPLATSALYPTRFEAALGPSEGSQEYVRWDLAGGVLSRATLDAPQGNVVATTARLTGVTSTTIFRYFDQSGAEIVDPLDPADFADCSIRVRVTITAAPAVDGTAFDDSADVEIRNRLPGGIEGC